MTLEEAGEIILEGKAWEPCSACRGTGAGQDKVVTVKGLDHNDNEVVDYVHTPDPCWRCQGKGWTSVGKYVAARQRIGGPYPPRPRIPARKLSRDKGVKMKTIHSISSPEYPSKGTHDR